MSDPQLVKNDEEQCYELLVDDERIGRIDWKLDGNVVELVHTEVDPKHSGQGYAGMLADFALTDIAENGQLVRPTCPYVATHIKRNPEYGSNVVE